MVELAWIYLSISVIVFFVGFGWGSSGRSVTDWQLAAPVRIITIIQGLIAIVLAIVVVLN